MNANRAVALIQQHARDLGIDVTFDRVVIHTLEEAHEAKFLGSPTVRIKGLDVEPDARTATDYSLG